MSKKNKDGIYEESKLKLWFNLSYASFAVLPRVLMEDMSLEWQNKMADLLFELDDAFPNMPDIGYRVQATKDGRLTKMPKYLCNYRRPDFEAIKKLKDG